MTEISIVPMTAAHIDAIYEIELESFTAPWPKDAFPELMENPVATFITAISNDDTIVGFAAMYTIADEAQILNIAVTPNARNNGIGAKLLADLIDTATKRGATSIYLEVRESNTAAQSLYKKQNFTPIGKRKNYYQSPTENAIVMGRTRNAKGSF
jgi:ribosomal-protein-alanine acetyltransferase